MVISSIFITVFAIFLSHSPECLFCSGIMPDIVLVLHHVFAEVLSFFALFAFPFVWTR